MCLLPCLVNLINDVLGSNLYRYLHLRLLLQTTKLDADLRSTQIFLVRSFTFTTLCASWVFRVTFVHNVFYVGVHEVSALQTPARIPDQILKSITMRSSNDDYKLSSALLHFK